MMVPAIPGTEGPEMPVETRAAGQTVLASREGRTLLLRARELRGDLSLAAAARRIGIRADELGKIERGETRQVRWETLLGIASAYDVEVADLLVTTSEPEIQPAYAGVLTAIRAGQISGATPKRFRGDPDRALAERQTIAIPPVDAAAAFVEPVSTGVRRGPFRPAR